MRSDMPKVIVERPRLGSRGPFRKPRYEKNAALADLPAKEGMRRRAAVCGGRRGLNENLGPLERFLARRVGRPWNKVYSEISGQLRSSSAVQQHVRDHLWDFVERHPTLGPRGEVYARNRWGQVPRRMAPGELFVHPKTGILLAVRRTKGWQPAERRWRPRG